MRRNTRKIESLLQLLYLLQNSPKIPLEHGSKLATGDPCYILLKITPFARLTEIVICWCPEKKTTSPFSPENPPTSVENRSLPIGVSGIIVCGERYKYSD